MWFFINFDSFLSWILMSHCYINVTHSNVMAENLRQVSELCYCTCVVICVVIHSVEMFKYTIGPRRCLQSTKALLISAQLWLMWPFKLISEVNNDSWMCVRHASKLQRDELKQYEIHSHLAKKTAQSFFKKPVMARGLIKESHYWNIKNANVL